MSPIVSRILVLCEGNHCRSPIAEALLHQALGPAFQVTSAGLGALVGHPPHEMAQLLMKEIGLDISGHRGRQFTSDMALKADLILVMDQEQLEACEDRVPLAKGRIFLLGQWLQVNDRDIPDPVQAGSDVHRQVLSHIQRALTPWIECLTSRTS